MVNKTIGAIRRRKLTQTKAEAIRKQAAEARGAKPKKKAAAPKPAPKKTVRRKPTPAQKVPSISGGTGARAKRMKELEEKIRKLEGR